MKIMLLLYLFEKSLREVFQHLHIIKTVEIFIMFSLLFRYFIYIMQVISGLHQCALFLYSFCTNIIFMNHIPLLSQ